MQVTQIIEHSKGNIAIKLTLLQRSHFVTCLTKQNGMIIVCCVYILACKYLRVFSLFNVVSDIFVY